MNSDADPPESLVSVTAEQPRLTEPALSPAKELAPKFTPPLSGGVLGGGDESCLHTRAMARWMLATLLRIGAPVAASRLGM